jgi:dihydroorotate dehydrogenase (fumarate)
VSVDLHTRYLGLELCSPLVASSSPYTGELATARRLEAAGAAAIVLPSLFEEEILNEEIQLNRSLEAGTDTFPEALTYFPEIGNVPDVGERYLERLERMKRELSIPVIASLNATTIGSWVSYARRMQDAGADALEVNLYHVVADPTVTTEDREAIDLELIAAVRAAITIPLAVKLSPYYTAMANFAARARAAGADGLVLFNRFYQPDLDLESLEVVAKVELSHSGDLRVPMRWLAILRPQLGDAVSLAATSGIHTGADAIKALMVGADIAMMTSALLRNGPEHLRTVEAEVIDWLEEHEYESVTQLRGSATQASVEDPSAFERGNYMTALRTWSTPPELATA